MYICEINEPQFRVCVGGSKESHSTAAFSPLTALASYLYRLLHQVHLGLMPGKHLLKTGKVQ